MKEINIAYLNNQLSSMLDKYKKLDEKSMARWLAKLSYSIDHEACMITVNTLESDKNCELHRKV